MALYILPTDYHCGPDIRYTGDLRLVNLGLNVTLFPTYANDLCDLRYGIDVKIGSRNRRCYLTAYLPRSKVTQAEDFTVF